MVGKINSLTQEKQAEYLNNTYGITNIELVEQIQHICPLGEQVGITTYKICVIPDKQLAELVQLHWDIQELVGKTFTLESGLKAVLEIVKKHYTDAKSIKISASCPPNRHMAGTFTIEYNR